MSDMLQLVGHDPQHSSSQKCGSPILALPNVDRQAEEPLAKFTIDATALRRGYSRL